LTLPDPPEPLAVPVLDSHCHLDIVGRDVGEQLAAARAVGVDTVVQVGIDVESSQLSAQLAAEHAAVWAAVALHPNDAGRGAATPEALAEIERLAGLPSVVAVGETGLDHYRTPPEGRGVQEQSFRAHIDIAKRTGKALVIHDREAHADVLRVLAEEGAPERVVFHCFSGDAAMAQVCAEHGWFLSFAGNITFKNAQDLRDAAAVAPADLLLVETDAPFLTPMPWRGRPNASYLIPLTVRALAQVKAMDVDELCGSIASNGRRAFAL
jgi:TatD DNase family protein